MNRTCKLVVLGDSGVGKTTIVHQFTEGEFRADFKATIGVDFSSKTIEIGEDSVDLNIWDTAGEERFHSVGVAFYRGVEAVILVYDITQKETLDHLQKWKEELYINSGIPTSEEIPMIIFGNKADLEDQRQVSREAAEGYASSNMLDYIETSAFSGQNIGDVFDRVAHKLFNDAQNGKITTGPALKVKKDHHVERYQTCVC